MNLALRDVRYNKGRFALTCLGLGLLLSVVMTMGGVYRGLIVEGLAVLNAVQADLWVVQNDTLGPFGEDSRIPEDLQYTIRSVPGVVETGPITFRYMQLEYQGRKLRFYLIGYRWDGMGGPRHLVAGRPISQKHYELVADKKLGVKLGDTFRLGLHDYTVVGLIEDMVSPNGDPVIYASLPDAQELLFQKNNEAIRNVRARLAMPLKELRTRLPGLAQTIEETVDGIVSDTHIVNAILVRIDPGTAAETVAAHIASWNRYAALTKEQETEILTKLVIDRSKRQIGLFRIILLSVSLVIIALIVYTLTLDKIRELATLKLIGAPNHRIVGLIMQQSLAMGALGHLIGAAFIYAIYDQFPKRVVLVPFDLEILFLIVMAICMVASLYGVRTALKVDPSVVLGA